MPENLSHRPFTAHCEVCICGAVLAPEHGALCPICREFAAVRLFPLCADCGERLAETVINAGTLDETPLCGPCIANP